MIMERQALNRKATGVGVKIFKLIQKTEVFRITLVNNRRQPLKASFCFLFAYFKAELTWSGS